MTRTPCDSGGSEHLVEHHRLLATPSIRGIEKPYTSASITATLWPCWASATARLAVTEDLPTPPLPEEISSGRVREPGSLKGMARPSAWPWAGWEPAVDAGVAVEALAQLGALVVGHHGEVEGDVVDAGQARTAPVTRLVISARSGHPATVRATRTATRPPCDVDRADHAEVDDRAVQLGVLDRAQRFDDLVGGDGHGGGLLTPGISPIGDR